MSSDYVKNDKSTYLPDTGTGRVSISMLGSSAVHFAYNKDLHIKKTRLPAIWGLSTMPSCLMRKKVPNPRHLINACRNLRRKQKALSRKREP